MHSLESQVAIVTGGGRGIGGAISSLFARAGASVVVAQRDEKSAQEKVDDITAAGGKAINVPTDVGDTDRVKYLIDETMRTYGRIDILVNNAGLTYATNIPTGSLLDLSEADWQRVLNVNLTGAFRCGQAAARVMTESKGGSIINIVSIHTYIPLETAPHYSAAKAGLAMLTKNMALSLAPHGIRANAIAPGAILTREFNQALPKEFQDEFSEQILLKRWGEPDEVAKAALFLASDAASYITGHVLAVDGGYLAWK
jgi:NAD(P)-dependent dehydrogenase (short-subunit alcohol dehydrogenase family)